MEHDQQTVHYVTQDAMPNLKLRVSLTLLSAARSRPAREAASGGSDNSSSNPAQPAESAANQPSTSGRSDPFKITRVFSWQEKVYSKAELVAAQAQHQASKQQGARATSPRRAAHFGSQTHVNTDRLLSASPEASILFSYVQTDDFCERFEASRSITTSRWEQQNHLARKLATDARNRQKVLNFQSMCIMADLGDETTVAGSNEKLLCVLRAHHDGSFDMTPGFSTPAQRYRFEDDHGSIYEYSLELASQTSAPSLEKHTAKLASVVAAQAEELRKQHNKDKLPVPGPDANALRLLLLAELVSAAGYERDRLYVEWQLHFDPEQWILQHSEQEVVQPGLIQGVTHVSQMVQYPADPSTDTPAVWVAHFAHPIEVEWLARATPAPKHWPRLLLQVCTYDLWDRHTTEGYGWVQLGPNTSSGSCTHYVDTWKPLGSRRDQQQAFFIGGSQELQDMSYVAVPKGHQGRVLNKYGYKTQTSGNMKVRTHMVLQAGSAGGTSPSKAAAHKAAGAAAAARQRRSLSLAVVLERARSRLQEARGGEVVVREGLLVQPPTITAQPLDFTVNEGATVQLSVSAVGLAPLRYQWFRDSKRLTVATSNTPLLMLVDVCAADSGSYHCQVSNKDGTASSSKALLTVNRVGRLQAATAASMSGAAGSHGSTPEPTSSTSGMAAQGPLLSSTLVRRTTVPRTLPVAGSPSLPFSTRLASSAGAGTGGGSMDGSSAGATGTVSSSSSLSPLRTSLALSGGLRPLSSSSAGRPASGTAGGVGERGAGSNSSGSITSGRTGLQVPLRRFAASSRPSTAPAAEATAAAGQAANPTGSASSAVAETPAAGASQDASGGSTTRQVSGGWFAADGGTGSPSSSAAGSPAAGAGVRVGAWSSPLQPSQEQQQQQQQGADDAVPVDELSQGSAGSVVGSPARLSSTRRTRVSEQQ